MMLRLFIVFSFFIIADNASSQLNLYYGNLHSHTDYTGGMADPITAYNYARNIAQIDILAVTDHNEGLNNAEWDSTLAMANRANLSGGFVALTGYEWTSPGYNHVNVFNTESRVSRINITDWNVFVQDVIGFGTAFCQFNHPGMIGSNNWDNFTYLNPETDSVFRLIEIRNFADDIYYIMALDKGWHVSATNNQDNHQADWGNANDCRTGIWAESLTSESIINAMHSRLTFSTMDKNASAWLDVNGTSMGSVLNSASDLNVHLMLSDNDNEVWEKIELVGENGAALCTINNNKSSIDTNIILSSQTSKYLFIRAKQVDGDYLWSAPVFINYAGSGMSESSISEDNAYVFPNIVTDKFSVRFEITKASEIEILLYDLNGKVVKCITNENFASGNHLVEYRCEGIKNGVYLIKIKSENKIITKKIIFI